MKNGLIALGLAAGVMLAAGNKPAEAVVYCKYVGVPKGCVAKPGVVLKPAPVRRGAAVNRGGPVNHVGPR